VSSFFAFTTIGVLQGLTYAIVALGMVLIYKGSRTLNFAQPFMGLFAAFVCWYLTGNAASAAVGSGQGIETGPAFIKWLKYPLVLFPFDVGTRPRFVIATAWALVIIGFVAWRLEDDIMRLLEKAPRVVNLVATIALGLGFLSFTQIIFNRTQAQAETGKSLPVILPASIGFNVGSLRVTAAYVQILIIVPLIAAATAAFFKFTKFGVAIRASAENREAAQLLGISARRVSSFTWVAGGVLAGLAAVLIVPARGQLDVASLSTAILVRGLAAALVGGLTSLPGAFVGGIVIGVAEFLTRWQTGTPGVPETVFFGIVIAVLIFRPGGIFGRKEEIEDVVSFIPAIRDMPTRIRQVAVSQRLRYTAIIVGICLVSAVSLATGPFTNGVLTDVIVFAIAGVSLTLLIGYAGQISLGHFALVGVGALAAGNLYAHGPIPFPLVFPLVILIGMAVALVIGLPALRIRGPYLAVVTVAFAVASTQWIFRSRLFARGTTGVTFTPQDYGLIDFTSDTNRPVFFFGFAMFLLCCWVAHNFKQSRSGRGFFSLRENEKAAATFGIDLTRYRLLAFTLSGGMAALGGAVFALRSGTGGVAAVDFPAEISLLLVAMVIIGGLGSLVGAGLGAFLVFGVNPLLTSAVGTGAQWIQYLVIFAAGTALILVITRARGGLAGLVFLPRDPVVQGVIWQDEEARRAEGNGKRDVAKIETVEADETATLPEARPKARRRRSRSASRR
jgi:ABC-type branched-subunit amino acid transport system permease subunit